MIFTQDSDGDGWMDASTGRIDVDDPLFGYLAVTADKGWMQGFVTCTTFTTWHRGFRWESLNPCLDLTASHGGAEAEGGAKLDADGMMTDELMTSMYVAAHSS